MTRLRCWKFTLPGESRLDSGKMKDLYLCPFWIDTKEETGMFPLLNVYTVKERGYILP